MKWGSKPINVGIVSKKCIYFVMFAFYVGDSNMKKKPQSTI